MKKNLIFKYLLLLTVTIGIAACSDVTEEWLEENPVDEEEVVMSDEGTLDLSNYVAVGNSLTAGFYDGALFPSGQPNSYAAILGGQFEIAGGGAFNNPDIISGATGTGRISLDLAAALAFLNTGEGSLADALITGAGSVADLNSATISSINNFGVPGARSVDLVTPGYGAANPFFGAFQSDAAATVIGDAAAAAPTFFSLWIGSNDVLGYTLAGGVEDVYNPLDPSTITSTADFSGALTASLDALSAGGADGIILTIPPVTTIPYVQAATDLGGGINLLPGELFDAATAAGLNAAYAEYNGGLDALVGVVAGFDQAEADRRKISFTAGEDNPPVITDESLTDLSGFGLSNWRQASATNTLGLGDLFPLDALFVLGVTQEDMTIPGVSVPLADQYTLTESEQVAANTAVATFNTLIRAEAAARDNITLVDLDPLFADANGLFEIQAIGLGMSEAGQDAADGVFGTVVNGTNLVPISFDEDLLYNSLFSTDFVHPNPRGYALVANEIIEVLNATYNASIIAVNPLEYAPINAPL